MRNMFCATILYKYHGQTNQIILIYHLLFIIIIYFIVFRYFIRIEHLKLAIKYVHTICPRSLDPVYTYNLTNILVEDFLDLKYILN